MKRRRFLAGALLPLSAWAAKVQYPPVTPRALVFPRDYGAHPAFRTEWWYLTGWLDGPLGFQLTFFRARPEEQSDNPSSFNPRQILFAHAALSDPHGDVRAESTGYCRGRILTAPVGSGGFGYDPLFEIIELHQTFGQLSSAVKRVLSHRSRAIRQLVPQIVALIASGEWAERKN